MTNKLPKCKLLGTDGNVFSIIGAVCARLKKAGQQDKALDFRTKVITCKSYGDVLILCGEYVVIH